MLESYRQDPEGKPVSVDPPQARILRSLAEHDRTVVRSSHGIGKTTAAAWAACWWVATRYPALVVTLAGTWGHLADKLWPEIHSWSRQWRLREAFDWQVLGAYSKTSPDSWRIVASSSDKAENIEGWHSSNLLILIDEAKALPDEMWAAIRGALTQTSGASLPFTGKDSGISSLAAPPQGVGLGVGWGGGEEVSKQHVGGITNPFQSGISSSSSSGMSSGSASTTVQPGRAKVLVLSTPPLAKYGWYSDLFGVKGSGWSKIHVSGYESPRVSTAWLEEMRADFGEESPVYQSKVLGDIPEGSSESVIQLRWIEAQQGCMPRPDRKPVVLTLDVAREGEDLSVIGRFKAGRFDFPQDSTGRPLWRSRGDLMELVGLCVTAIRENAAQAILIDDTGIGGGVTDRLLELRRTKDLEGQPMLPVNCQVIPVKFGSQAERTERFTNLKSELWWWAREALRQGLLSLPTDDELAALHLPRGSDLKAQLAAPIYEEDSNSRLHVLDRRKDGREKTKALPTKSPDLAHALILGARYWMRVKDLPPDEPRTVQEQERKKFHETIRKRIAARQKKKREGGPGWAGI